MCNVDFTIILFFVNSKNQIFRLPVFSIFSSCSLLSSITIYVTITQNHRPTSANVKRQKKENHKFPLNVAESSFDYSDKSMICKKAKWFDGKFRTLPIVFSTGFQQNNINLSNVVLFDFCLYRYQVYFFA